MQTKKYKYPITITYPITLCPILDEAVQRWMFAPVWENQPCSLQQKPKKITEVPPSWKTNSGRDTWRYNPPLTKTSCCNGHWLSFPVCRTPEYHITDPTTWNSISITSTTSISPCHHITVTTTCTNISITSTSPCNLSILTSPQQAYFNNVPHCRKSHRPHLKNFIRFWCNFSARRTSQHHISINTTWIII